MFGNFGKILRKSVVYLIFLIVGAAIGMHGLETMMIEVLKGTGSFFSDVFKQIPSTSVKA